MACYGQGLPPALSPRGHWCGFSLTSKALLGSKTQPSPDDECCQCPEILNVESLLGLTLWIAGATEQINVWSALRSYISHSWFSLATEVVAAKIHVILGHQVWPDPNLSLSFMHAVYNSTLSEKSQISRDTDICELIMTQSE